MSKAFDSLKKNILSKDKIFIPSKTMELFLDAAMGSVMEHMKSCNETPCLVGGHDNANKALWELHHYLEVNNYDQ